MNFLKYFFVSGESFFYGILIIIFAAGVSSLCSRQRLRNLTVVTAAFGFLLVIFSTTPISWWFYLGWLILILLWAVVSIQVRQPTPKLLRFSCVPVIVFSLIGIGMEWPYWKTPKIEGRYDAVYVVGDSISGGIGREKMTWPQFLQRDHQIKVINLAVGGSTVSTALNQVQSVKSDHALVLLEIGGNDLLHSTPPADFETGLRTLLKAVKAPGRILVMFELPLFPSRKSFGGTQRRLAAEFEVYLIPKRYFAQILLSEDATLDSIHLSDVGHQRMADLVWTLIGRYNTYQ